MPGKKLSRWDPFRELVNLREEMDRFFNTFFGRRMEETKGFWSPVIDIEEDNDNFIVKIELPGVTKKNIKISVRGNLLTITGHRKQESEAKNKTFHCIERSYGKFMRTITLPSEVNADDVKAKCKNGILTITLPKPESMKPKEITVELS